jgi:hypothetical protein
MIGYKKKIMKVMNGANANYVFKEQELTELIRSGILVKMLDSDTKEYLIRIKPSIRRELKQFYMTQYTS